MPLPPLDGLKILTGILPDFWYPVLAPLDQYGFMILFAIIFFQPRIILQYQRARLRSPHPRDRGHGGRLRQFVTWLA